MSMPHFRKALCIVDCSKHVGHVCKRENFGTLQLGVEIGFVNFSLIAHVDDLEFCSLYFRELLPRHKIAMMFHLRDHDFISWLYEFFEGAPCGNVQSFSSVFRKYDLLSVLCVH